MDSSLRVPLLVLPYRPTRAAVRSFRAAAVPLAAPELAEAGIADSAPFMAPMASRPWKPSRIESIEAAAISRSPLMMWIFAVIAARLPKGAGTVRGR